MTDSAQESTASGPSIQLGEDFADIRSAVRQLCADYPGEYWRRLEATEAYPSAFVNALTQAGFLGALIPEEFGGSGLPLRAASVILTEIHAAGCSAGACHAQMYTMGTILRHGSSDQKARYLPSIAAGELRLQAFGITEPTSGSDTTNIKTRAVRNGEFYSITGQKVWTSRALHSDLMLLLARTTPLADVKRKTDGMSVFIVDLRQALGKGLDIRPLAAMINHNTTEVFLDDVQVPVENLIGVEGQGFRYLLDGLNAERILIASEALGDARWFVSKASAYASERVVFGRPIGQNQGIQFPIARAHCEAEAADILIRKATALFDAGADCGPDANIAKLLASEASWHAAEAALQTHGGYGFAREYDIERKWRETRLFQVAPISTNLILGYVAQHVLHMPRSY